MNHLIVLNCLQYDNLCTKRQLLYDLTPRIKGPKNYDILYPQERINCSEEKLYYAYAVP